MSGSLRCAGAALACLALVALVGPGCSGGGGGGGGEPEEPPFVIGQQVNYSFSPPVSQAPLLSVAFEGQVVQFTDVQVLGTYDRGTREATMQEGSRVRVLTQEFGEIEIQATEEVVWTGTDDPTAGAMQVDWEDGFVRMTVNPDVDGSGHAGVDLAFYPDGLFTPPITSLTWDDFEDVDESPAAQEYQVVASFAYQAWQFLFERALVAFEGLVLVIDSEDALLAAGGSSIAVPGAEFPPGSGSRGQIDLSWTDVSGDGDPGPGDDFALAFSNWWRDDPDDDMDELFDGILRLPDLTATQDPDALGADAIFDAFQIRETDSEYRIEPDATVLQGGFFLWIDW